MKRLSVFGTLAVIVLSTALNAAQQPPPTGRGGQRGAGPGGQAGAPNEGRGQAGPRLKIETDIEYARAGGRSLSLDLYRIDPAAGPTPVVVWIHGESSSGSKTTTPAAAFVSAGGFAVASVEYRTGAGTSLAMQLADVKAAVRWLRANATAYKFDAEHIAAMGYGTGGQLAALLGTTGDVAALEGGGGNADQSSRVQGVVDLAGSVTAGGVNPATYATKDDAPTLILHGTADAKVSTRESQALVSALKVAGVTATLDLQMAVGHDLGALLSPTAMQTISTFLNQQLLGARTVAALSSFISTPADTYIDPIALDLGGTQYRLYPTPARGARTFGSYRVYLPPDYQTSASRRYPVIYFLHGRSVDSKRPLTAGYISRVDAAIRSGVMPPAIIVIPQGLITGWYLDAEDGQHPMESVIIKDLIPFIDRTYRTTPTREARAIEGHSMGGYGALHLGFKYPDLFAAVTGNSPALVEDVTDGVGSPSFWETERPSTLAARNTTQLRRQKIRIIAGEQDNLIEVARKLHARLTELAVPHEFFPVVGSPHNHDQLLQYETFDTMAFYGALWGKARR